MCPEGSVVMGALQSFIAFSAGYFQQTSSVCLTILSSYAVVWIMWQFYCLAAAQAQDSKQVIEQFTAIIVSASFLSAPSWVFEFYRVILSTGIWAAGKAYSASDGAKPGNVGELACYAMNGIDHAIWRMLRISVSQLDIGLIPQLLWVVVLFIPVGLLMFRIMRHVSEPLLDVSILFVLLPFCVLFAAIQPLRGAAMQSIKMLIVSMKELVVVSSVVGVMMTIINRLAGWTPLDGDTLDVGSSMKWLGGEGYFLVLVMILFFFFAFERAVQVPSRLLGFLPAAGIRFKIPTPF